MLVYSSFFASRILFLRLYYRADFSFRSGDGQPFFSLADTRSRPWKDDTLGCEPSFLQKVGRHAMLQSSLYHAHARRASARSLVMAEIVRLAARVLHVFVHVLVHRKRASVFVKHCPRLDLVETCFVSARTRYAHWQVTIAKTVHCCFSGRAAHSCIAPRPSNTRYWVVCE